MSAEGAQLPESSRKDVGVQVSCNWINRYEKYACLDKTSICIPQRTASVRDLGVKKSVPRNYITCVKNTESQRPEPRVAASGIEFDRFMTKVFGGSDDIRTIIFPTMVRTIRQGAFHDVKSLQAALLNEGLEVVGIDEYTKDGG